MTRTIVGMAMALALCLSSSFVHGQQRGKAGEKSGEKPKTEKSAGEKPGGEKSAESRGGSKPPGGAWSEGKKVPGNAAREEGKTKSPQEATEKSAAAEQAAGRNKQNEPSGAEGAAAGAAAANRNKPAASGAQGAAAGAAAANRNQPAASGAEGAAAGAAAANRNQPAASGAQGAVAGAAVADRNQPAASGAAGAAAGYAAVRNSFDHPNVYSPQWYGEHEGAWSAAHWNAGTAWTATTLASVASHCGYASNTAVSYGYGSNVTCQNGNVMLNGQNVGTAEEFSQKAADLALFGQNATTASTDHWLPLGVFALVRNEDQHPQLTLQLAIDKQGILRGNYTDLVSDHTLPIEGAVDKETQRAAWTIGNNKNFFMEAGVSNLTSGDAPALIHKSGRTELWHLVRLSQPDQTLSAN